MSADGKYAALRGDGGKWSIIERKTDTFGKTFWVAIATAATEWDAHGIVDGLNTAEVTR